MRSFNSRPPLSLTQVNSQDIQNLLEGSPLPLPSLSSSSFPYLAHQKQDKGNEREGKRRDGKGREKKGKEKGSKGRKGTETDPPEVLCVTIGGCYVCGAPLVSFPFLCFASGRFPEREAKGRKRKGSQRSSQKFSDVD